MNDDLSLRLLGRIMAWDDDRARQEYRWLKGIAHLKYDAYRDFQAGMRFIESLANWLQQFDRAERETAYAFVRTRLVFIGRAEMHHLVDQFYPKIVHEQLLRNVAAKHELLPYQAALDPPLQQEIRDLRRKTLFLGLSDGARIDVLRHSTVGILNNEQLVATTTPNEDKWRDLGADLRRDLEDDEAKFEMVYLIDDFVASGTSLLRYDKEKSAWKGKLRRFMESIKNVKDDIFSDDWLLCIHHYIAAHAAIARLESAKNESEDVFRSAGWGSMQFSFGMTLPSDLPLSQGRAEDRPFISLADRYYDQQIETKHTRIGGVDRIHLGYAGCALPVVLEHNTPNNSVALLWAETQGSVEPPAPAMRPLFRRRQRHI